MNDKTEILLVLTVIVCITWLFFPDFDGKDSITSYSLGKSNNCKTKEECKIKALKPVIYSINKAQKEIYYSYYDDGSKNIFKLTNCDIIDVKNWECREYSKQRHTNLEVLVGLDKMVDGIITNGTDIDVAKILGNTLQYVPKWKWKLVRYSEYQPELN